MRRWFRRRILGDEMYKKVLLPIDGSSFALAAINEVRRVIDPQGQAILLEVIDSEARLLSHITPAGFPYNGGAMPVDLAASVVRAQREDAARHTAEARALLEYGGVRSVETRIVEGVPGEAIVATAIEERCDLVVMATHGRSGLARAFLGSVAEHVVRHLRSIPVLLVHPAEEVRAAAREQAAAAATGGA
jgi:nucleotide-binding universal stress UspA family protein